MATGKQHNPHCPNYQPTFKDISNPRVNLFWQLVEKGIEYINEGKINKRM